MKRIVPDNEILNILDILESMHPEAACALDHRDPFQLVIAVALSAQTTDVSVNKATPALFAKYPTPEALAAADQDDVMEIIHTIGLYRNNSRNIIRLAQMLISDHNGTVPCDFDSLVKLPGVGRKTANVVLAEGFDSALCGLWS